MKNSRTFLRIIIAVIVLGLFFGMYYYAVYDRTPKEVTRISIVVYGNDSERWENLRRGAEQAADLLSAEVTLVTMSDTAGAEEQKKLLQREIDNGADALMIAACDSAEMKQYIETLPDEIPVLLVESGIGYTEDKLCISADNYTMGQILGEAVAENERPEVKVAIICDHEQRDSVAERYQGVYDSLVEDVDRITIWKRKENEADIRSMLFLQRELTEEAVDVVVALDTSSTEAIIDAVENLDKEVQIYGIANSDKAVYYLDNGILDALGYQNEFSIGYLGVQELMGEVHFEHEEYRQMIAYRVVTKKTLYETDNQKMLFPFVK